MSTSTATLTTIIPAVHDEPAIHIRLRLNPDGTVTLAAHTIDPLDRSFRLRFATTATVDLFHASMLVTPDGPVIQAGVLTVPLTGGMLATILGWRA